MKNTDRIKLVFLDNTTVQFESSANIKVDAYDDMDNKVVIPFVYVNVNNEFNFNFTLENGSFYFVPNHIGKYVFSGIFTKTASCDVKIGIADFKEIGYLGPFYVSKNGNNENIGSVNSPFETLEKAVYAAGLANTIPEIYLYEGNYSGDSFKFLYKNLTISGLGNVCIDGKGKPFIDLYKNTLKLDNLKLINFNNAICNVSNISINKCIFENNSGKFVIANYSYISINNSEFNKNSAEYIGIGAKSAIIDYWYYNPNPYKSNLVIINNSVFNENRNCFSEQYFVNVYVDNSAFRKNKGFSIILEYEYGIDNTIGVRANGNVTIKNSEFSDNLNTSVTAPHVVVSDSIFKNNKESAILVDIRHDNLNWYRSLNHEINYPGYGEIITKDYEEYYKSNILHGPLRNCTVYNCTFINNTGTLGGAIGSPYAIYATDSRFFNNSAEYGGALYAHGKVKINNCKFKDNSAVYGGAIFNQNYQFLRFANFKYYDYSAKRYKDYDCVVDAVLHYRDITVSSSEFVNNIAEISGGAIVCLGGTIDNTQFSKNNASTGGAIYVDEYYYVDTNKSEGHVLKVQNSDFISNSAKYGGGAIASIEDVPVIINNNVFSQNTANYGGALSVERAVIVDNRFSNNEANIAASLFTFNSTLFSNNFNSNKANFGNIVYVENIEFASSKPGLLGASVTDDVIYLFDLVDKVEAFDNGYCVELSNDKYVNKYIFYEAPEPMTNYIFSRNTNLGPIESKNIYYINGFYFIQNSIYRTNVSDYLKILIAYYHENENLSDLIWEFTDGDFRNSENAVVRDVISKFNNGVSGDYVVLENGSVKVFNYSMYLTLSQKQNKLAYSYDTINTNITKTALNTTVNMGEEVLFNITFENNNDYALSGVFISESYNKGLIFINHESSRTWNSSDNKTWYLEGNLSAGENVTIILKFKTNSSGVLENNVTAHAGEYTLGNSSDSVKVIKPDISVTKNTLNKTVYVGNLTMFEIIVKNTGNVDLEKVYVIESEYDKELVYVGYENRTGNWTYSFEDSKHTFYLDGVLGVGESRSFYVIFNTTEVGNFTNTVTAGFSNKTVNSTNTTEVINETDVPKDNTTDDDTPEDDTPEDEVPEDTPEDDTPEDDDIPTSEDRPDVKFDDPKDIKRNPDVKKYSKHPKNVEAKLDSTATGNPVFALLAVLIAIGISRRKK